MFIIDKLTLEISRSIQVKCRTYSSFCLEPISGISNDKWLLISTFPTQHVLRTTAAIPLWIIYAVVQGTLATGPWVIGSLDFKGLRCRKPMETHGFLLMKHMGMGQNPCTPVVHIQIAGSSRCSSH